MPQVWPKLDSPRKSYAKSPTVTCLYTSSVERSCTTCHKSLFQPLDMKMHTRNYSPCSFCTFLQNFNPIPKEKFMTIFPRSPVWNVIQEFAKRPTSSDHNSTKIARKSLKFGPKVQCDVFSNGFFLRLLKHHRKNVIVKMPRWPVWSSKTLESKALIPNVMKLAQEKIEKIDQHHRIQPLQGGNLLYIT